MDRKVYVIEDFKGREVVIINDVIFTGKRFVKWDDVEEYLKRFVGESYIVSEYNDLIYIGTDLPDEYSHYAYTRILKGANAKAKANAVQGIPELIEIASGKQYKENFKAKHNKDAKFGWYKYESRFALPVLDDKGEIERYNVFHVAIIVRHSHDGKMYLYDIMNIKKETSTLFQY